MFILIGFDIRRIHNKVVNQNTRVIPTPSPATQGMQKAYITLWSLI